MDVADQREDLLTGAGVEIPCRLVGEENRRIDRQRAGDRDALPFPAGQLIGTMVHALVELHKCEELARARIDLLARPSAEVQREADILEAREGRQQIEELKNESNLVAANARQRIVGQAARARRHRRGPRPRSAGRARRQGSGALISRSPTGR